MANANIETVSPIGDRVKVTLALVAVVAGIAGFYILAEDAMVLRVISVLAGLGLGALIGRFSEPGRRFFGFAQESWREAQRVVWPTRKETIQTTAVVFGFVFIMALFLWVTDKTLEVVLYDWILGWRR